MYKFVHATRMIEKRYFMKKIVLVRSNPVEPDSRVEKEANSLCKAGYEVTLFGWDRESNYCIKKDKKKLLDYEVDRFCVGAKAGFGAGFKSLLPYLKFQILLFCWILKNRKNYDVFHFCDFDTAFTGSKVCKIFRKPFVFDIFDYLSTDAATTFQKIIKRLEDNIINQANATIICTENRRLQIKQTNPKNLTVIHNSPPEYTGEKNGNINNERIKLVYVGVLLDHRMLEELLQVVSELPEMELHIGGFGKFEELVKKYANENENIIFHGKLPYDQTIELEKNCDIMTAIYAPYIGNHKYAAPNKFYEGLMLGKPLLMVKGTGMSEYIDKYDIGALIDYSKEGLVAGIQGLCKRRNEWENMSIRMRELYRKEFSWTEMEYRLQELYKNL